MKSLLRFLSLSFLLVFFSCSNELDINADWKDVGTVYGILDAAQDTNYVRVGRVYLGEEGISGGANEPDSLYYDNIDVTIEEVLNGNVIKTFTLEEDFTVELEPGFFTTEDYRIYRLSGVLSDNEDVLYRLRIEKASGESPITAETGLVKNVNIIRPAASSIAVNLIGSSGIEISWDGTEEAEIYQTLIRFHYSEQDRSDKSKVETKFVDYLSPAVFNSSNNRIETAVSKGTFFNNLANEIEDTEDYNRFFDSLGVYITAGAEDLATYIRVNQPSTGVNQNQPEFTNIQNGIGIFSATSITIREGKDITTRSLDTLVFGKDMCGKRFGKFDLLDTVYCN